MNTTVTPRRPYSAMVAALFKCMDTNQASLFHAVIGIAGETGELSTASTRKNLIEECGDIEFYLEAGYQILELIVRAPNAFERHWRGQPDSDTAAMLPSLGTLPSVLMTLGANLIDVVKKSWIYGRDVKVEETVEVLNAIGALLDQLYAIVGVTREEVLNANQDKLDKRYTEGVYSDAAALARADKVGEDADAPAPGARQFFGSNQQA